MYICMLCGAPAWGKHLNFYIRYRVEGVADFIAFLPCFFNASLLWLLALNVMDRPFGLLPYAEEAVSENFI